MANETCKGWKVIRKMDRRSCTADSRMCPITYDINKKIERPKDGGPLAVFETRKAARAFMKDYRVSHMAIATFCKIVKCIYKRSSEIILWEPVKTKDIYYGTYFRNYSSDGTRLERHRVPRRTAFADSVTCLE